MQSIKILYIEDDLELRGYFTEFLRRYYKYIYECASVEEGIELYIKYTPDILLLDINLPGQSGIDFASYIRKNNTDIRILMLTAYTNTEFMLKAVELDITRYLVKPVVGKELLEAFKKAASEIEVKNNLKIESRDLGKGFIYRDNSIINDDKVIVLRKKEIELLDFFIKHENIVLSYDRFENEIWQDSYMTQNSIRSQIKNLRQKTYHSLIENISGIGYRFTRA